MSVAVSRCRTWFQTRLLLTACQTRYHSHLWDHGTPPPHLRATPLSKLQWA